MSAPLHAGIHPPPATRGRLPRQTPPGRHPPWVDTPRQTSPGQTPWTDAPRQTPSWADTPWADTPCPVHAGIHTPLPSACWDTPLPSACWDTHTPLPSACWKHTHPLPSACWDTTPSPVQCMLGYGQQAGGMHPTGMHSCRNFN